MCAFWATPTKHFEVWRRHELRQLGDSHPPRLVASEQFRCSGWNFSAKLLDKGASRRRVGKAPAIINFALPSDSTSMSRLNVSRMMKLKDPAAQCDIQSVDSDGKLDDVWALILIRQRLGTTNLNRISPPFGRRVHWMDGSLMRSLRHHPEHYCLIIA
jgi:hypothetical protein